MMKISNNVNGARSQKSVPIAGRKQEKNKENIFDLFNLKAAFKQDKMTHSLKLRLSTSQYNTLKSWSKRTHRPMSNILRGLAFNSTGGNQESWQFQRLEAMFKNNDALINYFMNQHKTMVVFEKMGTNLNQAVHKLNAADLNTPKMRQAALDVERAANDIDSLFVYSIKQFKEDE